MSFGTSSQLLNCSLAFLFAESKALHLSFFINRFLSDNGRSNSSFLVHSSCSSTSLSGTFHREFVHSSSLLIFLSWEKGIEKSSLNTFHLTFQSSFQGVMSCLYSVWDISDDLIFRKVNESDASAFARLVGCCPPQVWGVFWLLISIGFFAVGIL